MIFLLQLTGFAFALSMIYLAILHYRKKALSSTEVVAWSIIWAAFILIISFPDIFRTFSKTFQFARLFDLMVVAALAVFSIVATASYLRSRKTQNKIEELVRDLANKDAKKNKTKF